MRHLAPFGFVVIGLLLVVPLAAQGGPESPWEVTAGINGSATDGNSETLSLGAELEVKRKPQPVGFGFYVKGYTAEDKKRCEDTADPTCEETTAEYLAGGLSTEVAFRNRLSLVASIDAASDEFAGYDSRVVGGLGILYRAGAGPVTFLDFIFKGTYTTEDPVVEPMASQLPAGATVRADDYAGAELGIDWERRFSNGASSVGNDLRYFPNFDESDAWRLQNSFDVAARVSRSLALKFFVEVRYENEPFFETRTVGDPPMEELVQLDDTDLRTGISLVYSNR